MSQTAFFDEDEDEDGQDRIRMDIPRVLKVTILKAENLPPPAKLAHNAKFYCTLRLSGKSNKHPYRTEMVSGGKDGVSPEWNSEFSLDDYMEGQKAVFQLFASDGQSRSKSLGQAKLPSSDFFGPAGFDGPITLQASRMKSSGPTLRVKLSIPDLEGKFQGDVSIKFIGAKNLKSADWWTGKSDPYACCYIRGRRSKKKVRTKTVPCTLDPTWNEEQVMTSWIEGEALEFLIYDADYIGSDFLGRAVLWSEQFCCTSGFAGDLVLEEAGQSATGVPTLMVEVSVAEVSKALEAKLSRSRSRLGTGRSDFLSSDDDEADGQRGRVQSKTAFGKNAGHGSSARKGRLDSKASSRRAKFADEADEEGGQSSGASLNLSALEALDRDPLMAGELVVTENGEEQSRHCVLYDDGMVFFESEEAYDAGDVPVSYLPMQDIVKAEMVGDGLQMQSEGKSFRIAAPLGSSDGFQAWLQPLRAAAERHESGGGGGAAAVGTKGAGRQGTAKVPAKPQGRQGQHTTKGSSVWGGASSWPKTASDGGTRFPGVDGDGEETFMTGELIVEGPDGGEVTRYCVLHDGGLDFYECEEAFDAEDAPVGSVGMQDIVRAEMAGDSLEMQSDGNPLRLSPLPGESMQGWLQPLRQAVAKYAGSRATGGLQLGRAAHKRGVELRGETAPLAGSSSWRADEPEPLFDGDLAVTHNGHGEPRYCVLYEDGLLCYETKEAFDAGKEQVLEIPIESLAKAEMAGSTLHMGASALGSLQLAALPGESFEAWLEPLRYAVENFESGGVPQRSTPLRGGGSVPRIPSARVQNATSSINNPSRGRQHPFRLAGGQSAMPTAPYHLGGGLHYPSLRGEAAGPTCIGAESTLIWPSVSSETRRSPEATHRTASPPPSRQNAWWQQGSQNSTSLTQGGDDLSSSLDRRGLLSASEATAKSLREHSDRQASCRGWCHPHAGEALCQSLLWVNVGGSTECRFTVLFPDGLDCFVTNTQMLHGPCGACESILLEEVAHVQFVSNGFVLYFLDESRCPLHAEVHGDLLLLQKWHDAWESLLDQVDIVQDLSQRAKRHQAKEAESQMSTAKQVTFDEEAAEPALLHEGPLAVMMAKSGAAMQSHHFRLYADSLVFGSESHAGVGMSTSSRGHGRWSARDVHSIKILESGFLLQAKKAADSMELRAPSRKDMDVWLAALSRSQFLLGAVAVSHPSEASRSSRSASTQREPSCNKDSNYSNGRRSPGALQLKGWQVRGGILKQGLLGLQIDSALVSRHFVLSEEHLSCFDPAPNIQPSDGPTTGVGKPRAQRVFALSTITSVIRVEAGLVLYFGSRALGLRALTEGDAEAWRQAITAAVNEVRHGELDAPLSRSLAVFKPPGRLPDRYGGRAEDSLLHWRSTHGEHSRPRARFAPTRSPAPAARRGAQPANVRLSRRRI